MLFGVVVGLLCLACASFPRSSAPPVAPPASAAYIRGADGTKLYVSVEGDPAPRGVVWYVVGPEVGTAPLYPGFTKALHQAGFATAILHPRGAGYSAGTRGDSADYALFLEDYQTFYAWLGKRFAGRPLFLLGHSVGATLALSVSARAGAALRGVILVNPAYKLVYSDGMGPSFADYFVYGFNSLFRRSALTVDMNGQPSAVKNERDRAEATALQADPLVVRYFSLRYLLAQRRVMDRSLQNIAATRAAMLVVEGERDALVDPKGTTELLAAARATEKQKLVALGAGHGSSAVETVVSPLVDWLSKRAPASATTDLPREAPTLP